MNELPIKLIAPKLVIVFRLLPTNTTVEPEEKVTVFFAPTISELLKPKVTYPLVDSELVPANVKFPLIATAVLIVSGADNVIVVAPLIVAVRQDPAISTTMLLVAPEITISSAAVG